MDARIGQLFMVGIPEPRVEATARHLIDDLQVGGIILFRRNIAEPQQLADLCDELQRRSLAASGKPLILAVDQEGGPVRRLKKPFLDFSAAREWGLLDDGVALEAMATRVAQEMCLVGLNMNLAPVLDVARSPDCPQWERSYGPEPLKAARLGVAALRGFQAGGVIPVAKHFPGLGTTLADSHQILPTTQEGSEAREEDLFPFRLAIAAGVPAIMSAHVVVPEWDDQPATLSHKILMGQLRGKMGFQGVILSDDLEMGAIAGNQPVAAAARQALAAGVNLLLICEHEEIIEEAHRAVRDDPSLAEAAETSMARILRLKETIRTVRVDRRAVQEYFASPPA